MFWGGIREIYNPRSGRTMPGMTIDNLASGLLGAVIGLGGAVVIQWYRDRLDGRSAARAVYMEVMDNGQPLVLAMQAGVYAPLTDSTWLASLARLSRLLSPGDLLTVAEFYHFVSAIRGRGYPVAGSASGELQKVAGDAFKQNYSAAMVLEKHGWTPSEREALHKAMGLGESHTADSGL